jgi:MFS transporter, DHA3 family, macrolide efflux protein
LRHLQGPQWVYGALMFANGAAELLTNLYVGKKYFRKPLVFTYSCEIFLGAGLLILAASIWLPMAYVWPFPAAILIGAAAATIDIPLLTVIQKQIPAEHTGKVISYWFTVGSCGGAAGSLVLGMLFEALPLAWVLWGAAVVCLAIGLLFYGWAVRRNTFVAAAVEAEPELAEHS